MSNMQAILEATKACISKAEQMYNIDLSQVKITFDLKGAAMGQACWRINRMTRKVHELKLRFNLRMCSEDMNDAINDTVPHEVAHLVCAVNPQLGANHNPGWRRVCLELGGTGKTYHDQEVIYAKGKTYAYTASCGTVVNLSEQRHKKVQRGAVLSLKRGGKITRDSEHQLVGVSGRRVGISPKQAAAAKKPATPVTPAATPSKPVEKMTKAEKVRKAILRCKQNDLERAIAVDFAVHELGMKPALARKYVNNNWDKV